MVLVQMRMKSAPALSRAWAATDVPVLILAHTIKGKGVDFMENNVVYHYASADSELCARAKASILKEG